MAEKTEKPTAKRKNDSRAEGQVANSQELTSAVGLFMGLVLLSVSGKQLELGMENIMSTALYTLADPPTPSIPVLRGMLFQYGAAIAPSLMIILFGLLATGSVVTLAQTNFLWASKKVGLNLKNVKLNPLSFFSRMFSITGLAEIVKSVFKLLIVGWIAVAYIQSQVPELLALGSMGIRHAFTHWAGLAYDLGMRIAFIFLLMAIADFIFQRWNTNRQMKMSKEEVKDERTQSEGNPTIKGALRRKQQAMAFQRMLTQVPEASVIITNPIHLAIAVDYKPGMTAPVVMAKGARLVAERIVRIAQEHDIPIVQNVPLAHAIYDTVEVDQEIPPEFYTAVAELLLYIYKMRGKLEEFTT